MGFTMDVDALAVPNEEAIKAEIVQQLVVQPQEKTALQTMAEERVKDILAIDLESIEDRQAISKGIEEFGIETMKTSASKNAMLSVSVQKLGDMEGKDNLVARGLVDLNKKMKELDPSLIDFTKTGFLGKLFNPLRGYFEKYEKADDIISNIIKSLEKGQETLRQDNVTLEIEEVAMRNLTKKLNKEIELILAMNAYIDKEIALARANNESEDKLRFIQEEVLFPLNQKTIDMQTLLGVNQQGILAVEIIRRNNKTLITSVERAKYVSISALRTGAMVAHGLYNQKVVLKKVEMINETTNNIIAGTSRMLKEQGVAIQKQAVEAAVSVDTLKVAFKDCMTAMDDISKYKVEALPKLKTTIQQFKELTDESEKYIQKLEKGNKLSLA